MNRPLVIDPANPHQYILITLEAFQEWAHALVNGKERRCLPYIPAQFPS
ncbi:hypothetical protein VP01_12855g1 [Puccinia sorghi]|uniref:Uncharacterized protein n=1 Tax=Puccinia sorghi TaxID=27349 RepID=A0A0L6VNI1_9BASI|nr:hypothetical protein VP01_12855g1 [Puccinia sorghi]